MSSSKKTDKPNPKISKPTAGKSKSEKKSVRIVAIGASAGGLQAIYSFFDNLKEIKPDVSFVIIQHLSPDYKSLMPELLERHTFLDIITIENDLSIEGGKVYVAQPNNTIKIEGQKFVTESRDAKRLIHYPINSFLVSLAQEQEEEAVAIILSGSGSDGTQGIEAIKEKGGSVLVQEESTATFTGMPKNAILTGLVDRVAPPGDIPEILNSLLNNRLADVPKIVDIEEEKVDLKGFTNEAVFVKLLELVKRKVEMDFTSYKTNTLLRRIERRMIKVGISKLEDYHHFVNEDKEEAKILANEFLINVTTFFRDQEAFAYFKDQILSEVIEGISTHQQIRFWSIGCATGQEPYSIAMAVADFLERKKLRCEVKIFATDAHAESLSYASRGVYSLEELDGVPQNFIEKYFIKQDEVTYQVKPIIRDMIVFAVHNVIQDPPFNKINLVSCRNVLIYLKPELQHKILSHIHFSLVENGRLFLGVSESPFVEDNKFKAIHAGYRFFMKLSGQFPNEVTGLQFSSSRGSGLSRQESNGTVETLIPSGKGLKPTMDLIKESILENIVPPTVILNDNNEVVHVFGEVERFLHFPKKHFQLNILKMIPEGLYIPVNALLTSVKEGDGKKVFKNVSTLIGNEQVSLRLVANPIVDKNSGRKFTAIAFTEMTQAGKLDYSHVDTSEHESVRMQQLEDELNETKDFLQSTVEQLETSNEELQATNEELIASNEELQSTNEELQSVNEELYSVNTEFQSKVAEMIEANDDLSNLLQGTEIGTIFLDGKRKIRRYTESIKEQINISDHDIGRDISDLNNKVVDVDLDEEAAHVLKDLVFKEREVTTKEGKNFLMRLSPYRSSADKIDGVVITFVNIDPLKKTEANLKEQSENLARVNKELEQVAYVATHDLRGPVINLRGLMDIHIKRRNLDREDEVVSRLNQNITRIINTLDGLIDVIAYQKSLSNKFEVVNLADVVDEVTKDIAGMIKDSSVEVNTDLEVRTIFGIPAYFKSILINLLTNSIKYADENRSPVIRIKTTKTEKNRVELVFSDNGIGIDKKNQEVIFQAFKRLATAQDGKGIGLYLVKSQVEAMKGEISLESTVGKGTSFIMSFPMRN